ncbi:unnamed protein product [Effrenium voratum]|nr:unnamed protein product [Effrenium voratum]
MAVDFAAISSWMQARKARRCAVGRICAQLSSRRVASVAGAVMGRTTKSRGLLRLRRASTWHPRRCLWWRRRGSKRPRPKQQAAELVDKSEEPPTRKRARQQEPSSASRAPPVPVEAAPRPGRGASRRGRISTSMTSRARAGRCFQAEAAGTRRLGAARRDPGADADHLPGPTIAQSFYGGDEVLLMAGRHRAAALAVLVRALFENISLEDSAQRVSRLRHIDFQAFVQDRRAADWLYVTWWSAKPFVAGDAPLRMFKQSAPNAEARLQGALLFGSIFEALAQAGQGGTLGRIMASLPLVPRQRGTIQATLEALALNFTLDEGIVQALLKSKIQNLEEFRFLFNTEEQIQVWVSKRGLGDESMVQARLRRAWNAASLYYRQSEQDRSRVSVEDLDALLADGGLRETKVRSLQFQLTTVQHKRKLAEGLYTETNEEEPSFQDWEGYLDKLHTLMVAYSMAGIAAQQQQPSAEAVPTAKVGAERLSCYSPRPDNSQQSSRPRPLGQPLRQQAATCRPHAAAGGGSAAPAGAGAT